MQADESDLAKSLEHFTNPHHPEYDAAFAKELRRLRPDWFAADSDTHQRWQVNEEGGLTYCEDPLGEFSDELDFDVESLKIDAKTTDNGEVIGPTRQEIQQLADYLNMSGQGDGCDEEHYGVCRGIIYCERDNGETLSMARLLNTTGCYSIDTEHDEFPSNRNTRRLMKYGCNHSRRCDHVFKK